MSSRSTISHLHKSHPPQNAAAIAHRPSHTVNKDGGRRLLAHALLPFQSIPYTRVKIPATEVSKASVKTWRCHPKDKVYFAESNFGSGIFATRPKDNWKVSLSPTPCARIHNRILPLPWGRYPGVRVNQYSQRHLPLPRGNYLCPYLGVGVTDIHNESLHRFGVGSYPVWGAG